MSIKDVQFKIKQPLDVKIKMSLEKIHEFYHHFGGRVYISFSGGLDSTVMLDLVRSAYPDVIAAYADTGLEFPENRRFVKSISNVEFLRPRKPFKKVIGENGYPLISKKQAQYIGEVQNSSGYTNTVRLRLTGVKTDGAFSPMARISKKWQTLCGAPFKVSDRCCYFLKEAPLNDFSEKHGKPFMGTRAQESGPRASMIASQGCNAYSLKRPASRPLAYWTGQDMLDYIKIKNLPYSKLYDMGYTKSGCMFCMFGVHLDPVAQCLSCGYKFPPVAGNKALSVGKCGNCGTVNNLIKLKNRFQTMKKTHPKHWEYCIFKLGLKNPLDFIGVPYE